MEKISVIIPTYNRASFLPFSISSVLDQTYRNIEIIVIDDGSTDNTLEVIEKIKKNCSLNIYYFYKENEATKLFQGFQIKKTKIRLYSNSFLKFLVKVKPIFSRK